MKVVKQLFPDFEEFFRLLNDHKVRYLLVGGYAFAVHAFPRYTNDLDIWLDSNEENANKVFCVLKDFGFQELNISIDDLTAPDKIIQIGYPPLRIDLITNIDGVDFNTAWDTKDTSNYGKQKINIINRQLFIRNKSASGRKKDKEDLEKLE